jgi:hypothetical protein
MKSYEILTWKTFQRVYLEFLLCLERLKEWPEANLAKIEEQIKELESDYQSVASKYSGF